ncbi:MAG: pseudaminic acid synthase [Helicobacteraceae bacterium]|jgi:N-acetylneuraminate synthase|nr:pseudaminic acid synthase [Helicobacteraceae bacterium]
MRIETREINSENPPYLVAEVSANHAGKIENALLTIEAAKKCGADAVKIQTYEPRSLTIDCDLDDFLIKDGLWKGKKLYELYKEAYTPFAWHKELFEFAKKIDITIFSTPFDTEGVELLKKFDAPAYKIASFEIVDLELIKAAAEAKKPMIISTGMASESEIDEAINAAQKGGVKDIILLHCVSEYPAPLETANTKSIPFMQKRFNLPIGLSDHTLENYAAISAISLGAVMIEKHFTIDKNLPSPDSNFSITPNEFIKLKNDAISVWKTLGKNGIFRAESEQKSKAFRRSLYAVKDIKKNEIFTRENVRSIRPGFGLAPKHIDRVLNSRAATDIPRGAALREDMIV